MILGPAFSAGTSHLEKVNNVKLREHTHRCRREAGKAAWCITWSGLDWTVFLRTLVFSLCHFRLTIIADPGGSGGGWSEDLPLDVRAMENDLSKMSCHRAVGCWCQAGANCCPCSLVLTSLLVFSFSPFQCQGGGRNLSSTSLGLQQDLEWHTRLMWMEKWLSRLTSCIVLVLFPANTAHSCETPSADLPKRRLLRWDWRDSCKDKSLGTT